MGCDCGRYLYVLESVVDYNFAANLNGNSQKRERNTLTLGVLGSKWPEEVLFQRFGLVLGQIRGHVFSSWAVLEALWTGKSDCPESTCACAFVAENCEFSGCELVFAMT